MVKPCSAGRQSVWKSKVSVEDGRQRRSVPFMRADAIKKGGGVDYLVLALSIRASNTKPFAEAFGHFCKTLDTQIIYWLYQ